MKWNEINIRCAIDDERTLNTKLINVLYVPDLQGNLISVQTLASKGFHVIFRSSECLIMKADEVVARAKPRHGLFVLDAEHKTLLTVDNTASCEALCIHTWHERLGHIDPRIIREMETDKAVGNFRIQACSILKTCECCM